MNFTRIDILCVKIAALCHDLGHGPLGHPFQANFMQRFLGSNWTHEMASVAMLKHIMNKYNCGPSHFKLSEMDMLFIEELSA